MYGNPLYPVVVDDGPYASGHPFSCEVSDGDVLGALGEEFEDGDVAYRDQVTFIDDFDWGIFWYAFYGDAYGLEEIGGVQQQPQDSAFLDSSLLKA